MSYWGDFPLEETLNFLFTTRQFSDGVPTVLSGTPVLSVYEDTSLTQITTGVTVTVDHDGVVGLNRANVVATAANGYEAGKTYTVVITTGTVGGTSVVGEVVGTFTINRGAALRPTTAGRTLDIQATGEADANLTLIVGGAVPAPTTTGILDVNVERWLDTLVTLTSTLPDVNTQAMTSGVITGNAVAASAVTELRSLTSGIADAGGSTTTLIDAALTEIDDTWNGNWLLITSGTDANRCRLITDFDAASDTITFAPAVSAAIGVGITYEILPAAGVDVQSWLATESAHAAVSALVSGRVDSSVGAMAASVLTAAAIAADAITAAKVAAGTIDAATFAAGAIDATAIATDAITAAKIAAGAITSSEAPNLDAAVSTRATPAQVNTEVSDVLKTDTISELSQAAPAATPTFETALMLLYMALRNKVDVDASFKEIHNDAGTVITKKALSDDATTYSEAEMQTGP